jgi:tetratricopeptide (TPR) repeat protein
VIRAAAVLLAVAVALAGTARAQPGNEAEAEKRFQQAEALYKRGEYLAAAAEYQAAYDLSGLPGLLYNVAQSYRLGGEKKKAAEAYRLFLDKAPGHQLAPVARGHLAALERDLASSTLPPEGPDTPDRPPNPRPDLTRRAAPAAPAGTGRTLRVAGLVSAGLGVVILGAAVHYGIEAKKASDAISGNDEGWTGSLLDRYDEGQSAETRMVVLSAVGAAALSGGAILYYLGWRAARAQEITVGAAPAAGGGAVTVGGAW